MTDRDMLAAAPYFKVMPWMVEDLGLKGHALTVFALMYEREYGFGEDSGRIDATYLGNAIRGGAAETFGVLSDLVKKGYLTPNFAGTDFVGAFSIDMDRVISVIEG